jgi:hypothetical protein
VDRYPLKNSAILSSGTTIHMFNEITRFINPRIRTADPGDFFWAGEHKVPLQDYGIRGYKDPVPQRSYLVLPSGLLQMTRPLPTDPSVI